MAGGPDMPLGRIFQFLDRILPKIQEGIQQICNRNHKQMLKHIITSLFCAAAIIASSHAVNAQPTNYDESKVPAYELPDMFLCNDGSRADSPRKWQETRRPEIMRLLTKEVYGYAPGRPKGLHFKVLSSDRTAMGGKATRKEVAVYYTKDESRWMTLLIYIPNNRKGKVPAFLGINFKGNHTTTDDPAVSLPAKSQIEWYGDRYEFFPRGFEKSRWEFEEAIAHGYASTTFCMTDVDPDWYDGFKNGVHGIFDKEPRDEYSWGAIAAWAWGLSRALDYLETDPDIDATKVAVHGHSRLSKTALWAGASDERFALVIGNCPGCTGAAISRRKYGETLKTIQGAFPHWFNGNYRKYIGKEEELPFDQHFLLACIAPRPLYIQSCDQDRWGDPKGEFLGLAAASPAWELFGFEGIHGTELPEAEKPIMTERLGYHLRHGAHDQRLYDWQQYIAFADKVFGRKSQPATGDDAELAATWLEGRHPGSRIEIISVKKMRILSTLPRLQPALDAAREAEKEADALFGQFTAAAGQQRKEIAQRIHACAAKAVSPLEMHLQTVTATPAMTEGKNYPAYPQKDYRWTLEVRYLADGAYPMKEYIFLNSEGGILYDRSWMMDLYHEYTQIRNRLDRMDQTITDYL